MQANVKAKTITYNNTQPQNLLSSTSPYKTRLQCLLKYTDIWVLFLVVLLIAIINLAANVFTQKIIKIKNKAKKTRSTIKKINEAKNRSQKNNNKTSPKNCPAKSFLNSKQTTTKYIGTWCGESKLLRFWSGFAMPWTYGAVGYYKVMVKCKGIRRCRWCDTDVNAACDFAKICYERVAMTIVKWSQLFF